MADEIVASEGGRVRIEWTIGNASGHGEWFPSKDRRGLELVCERENKEYGAGSHRVAIEPEGGAK